LKNKTRIKIFLTLLFLQLIVNVSIFLNVSIARQVLSLVYFTIMPGLLIILLMKPKELDQIEIVVFSVGLSLAFLMFAGVLVNELGPLLGISRPLSLMPLLTVLNMFLLVITFLTALRNDRDNFFEIKVDWKITPTLIFLLFLPAISIFGAIWMTIFRDNVFLLFIIALIALFIVLGMIFSKRVLPQKLYAVAVFLIALSIIFHSCIIFKYPISYGSDTSYEYFIYKSTEIKAYWDSTLFRDMLHGRLNSMASLTVLPTIWSTVSGVDSLYVRKVLYSVIFSFVPLILFQFWRKKYGLTRSFFAVFFFVSSITFYTEMMGLGRQMVSEIFLALLLLSIFNGKRTPFNKMCFVIFSAGLVMSHYALAEIFLGLSILTVLFVFLLTRKSSRKITVTMVMLLFVFMFAWYIYTSHSATFESTLSFGNNVLAQLNEFFDPSSREPTILRALGLEQPKTVWNLLSRIFLHLTEFFMVLGFFGLITKKVDVKLETDHFALTVVAAFFLALVIVLPGFSKTLNVTRFYHVLLFLLAPLCILGAEFLIKLLFKQRRKGFTSILLLGVLIPFFLFQIGFVYELTGTESWAPLSLHRMDEYRLYFWSGYVDDKSVFGIKWLSTNTNFKQSHIFADLSSIRHELRTYGLILDWHITPLSNATILSKGHMVYLNSLNSIHNITVTGTMVAGGVYTHPTSELPFLENMSKIYTSGGAEIYKNPP